MRTLSDIEADIRNYIQSTNDWAFNKYVDTSRDLVTDDVIWVTKFFPAKYLDGFIKHPYLIISTSLGFTWGDGVYVSPIADTQTAMFYGRACVVGFIRLSNIKNVFDATQSRGIDLYLEWIPHFSHWFERLATTVHADDSNRFLRNKFRQKFHIDLVVFPPDQYATVDNNIRLYLPGNWFALSDWSSAPYTPTQTPQSSKVVEGCKWVAIIGENYDPIPPTPNLLFQQQFSKHLKTQYFNPKQMTIISADVSRQELQDKLLKCYEDLGNSKSPFDEMVMITPR